MIRTRRDSAAVRKLPVCRIPAASRAAAVDAIPAWPLSAEWFEAVSQTSHPVHLMAAASSFGLLKIGYPVGAPAPMGVSTWQMARAARRTIGLTPASRGRKS
jgi:hypothetical protein